MQMNEESNEKEMQGTREALDRRAGSIPDWAKPVRQMARIPQSDKTIVVEPGVIFSKA
jgi:hypothetical protein